MATIKYKLKVTQPTSSKAQWRAMFTSFINGEAVRVRAGGDSHDEALHNLQAAVYKRYGYDAGWYPLVETEE